ncbi:glycosyltransferase family 2 protein [bacterium]|nr:glycosyltransferase family 2 protein [bacterium]
MISIVIPSWNGLHLLKTCLPALLRQTAPEYEIIVVDNGSEDGTAKWLIAEYSGVRCIRLRENMGFCGAVNRGIKAAGRNDVILLNNDTEVCAGWLNALATAVTDHPGFHLFASRVIMAESPHRIDTLGDGFTIAGFGYKLGWLQPDKDVFKEPREVFGGSGCALYIRRIVVDVAGLFDEDFFAFGEDLDFSFRARLSGFRVLSVPDARILHAVRATAPAEKTLFWYHRNLIWLLVKNLPWQLFLLYSPHIFLHILLVLMRSIIRGWALLYLKSLAAAVSGIPNMMKKRRQIQSQRKTSLNELRNHLDANWVGIHLKLHRAKKSMDQSVRG